MCVSLFGLYLSYIRFQKHAKAFLSQRSTKNVMIYSNQERDHSHFAGNNMSVISFEVFFIISYKKKDITILWTVHLAEVFLLTKLLCRKDGT